jgi:hypothetical protein
VVLVAAGAAAFVATAGDAAVTEKDSRNADASSVSTALAEVGITTIAM